MSILDRIQGLAIQHKASIWCEADLMAALGGESARQTLYDAGARRELYLRDVALWRGANKKWRLIDQQPPDSGEQAALFLSTKTDGLVCSFCRLDDEQVEFLKHGHYFLHPMCRRAWFRWVRAAIRQPRIEVPHWSEVLGIDRRTASKKEITAAYKRAAQRAHPDKKGGSTEIMTQLNQARDEALASPQAGNP